MNKILSQVEGQIVSMDNENDKTLWVTFRLPIRTTKTRFLRGGDTLTIKCDVYLDREAKG